MNLDEIKSAVESGKIVCWKSDYYRVIKDKFGQWFIKFMGNNGCAWGLTWQDGSTMNGRPQEFFVMEKNNE